MKCSPILEYGSDRLERPYTTVEVYGHGSSRVTHEIDMTSGVYADGDMDLQFEENVQGLSLAIKPFRIEAFVLPCNKLNILFGRSN